MLDFDILVVADINVLKVNPQLSVLLMANCIQAFHACFAVLYGGRKN